MRRAPIEAAAAALELRSHVRGELVKVLRGQTKQAEHAPWVLTFETLQELRALLKAEAKAGRAFARAMRLK